MSLSSSWLGYRPFKAEARVRSPLETRYLGWHSAVLLVSSLTPCFQDLHQGVRETFYLIAHDTVKKVPSVLHPSVLGRKLLGA